jgi:hypothetical protein
VNWSKYSKPWDAKFHHPSCGIGRIIVKDLPRALPEKLPTTDSKYHDFIPHHDPMPENYPHCEIRVFKEGVRVTKDSQISKLAKKEYRTIISDKTLILIEPKTAVV